MLWIFKKVSTFLVRTYFAFRWCILTLFIHILRTYIDSVRFRCLLFIPCSCIAHATFENESLKKNVTSHKGNLMMSTRFYSRFQGVLSSSTTQCNKLLGWKYSVEKRTYGITLKRLLITNIRCWLVLWIVLND